MSSTAALLADLGEDDIEVLAVDLEDWRAQLDLGAFGERQNRLQDLTGGASRRRLTGARTVSLTDCGEEQVQIARDVGEGADRGARVVG